MEVGMDVQRKSIQASLFSCPIRVRVPPQIKLLEQVRCWHWPRTD